MTVVVPMDGFNLVKKMLRRDWLRSFRSISQMIVDYMKNIAVFRLDITPYIKKHVMS